MTIHDVAIVGAGPAGLSAALYAVRYCRSTLVLHDGTSRASLIPVSHNVPGFDAGIAGPELLERMSGHAESCGAQLMQDKVIEVSHTGSTFTIAVESGAIFTARAVILATGVKHNKVPLEEAVHQAAINAGVLRYCPVCDGFEHRGSRIAVLGCDASGAAEALFVSGYSNNVTLLPRRDVELTADEQQDLRQAGVRIVSDAVCRFEPLGQEMLLHLEGHNAPLAFDVLYPALGTSARSRLACQLGLDINEFGNVAGTTPFGADIPGLYCAGDLVEGLDQISVAMGHGAIAATKAHNWLRECDGKTAEAVLSRDGP